MSSLPQEVVIPGLVDLHVHPRDFGQSSKEDFESASRAAIAGGVTTFGAMPNYEPELEVRPYNLTNMTNLHRRAEGRIYGDVGMWAAAQPQYDNVGDLEFILPRAIGTKFYIEPTQGNDQLFAVREFLPAARRIHELDPTSLIAAHAEDETIEETIGRIAGDLAHPLLIPHVNNRFVLDAIIRAKKKGWPVYAEACPHHMFMTEDDVVLLGWYARMKPRLASQEDQDYRWHNLTWFNTFGTDHAPHTMGEKDITNELNPEGNTGIDDVKSFGVPGLEAMLPLLLQAVEDGKLTRHQLIQMASVNPRRLIGLTPTAPSTSVRVSMERYEFSDADVRSKCGWSPYAMLGKQVTGRVIQVDLRGQIIYRDGVFTEPPQGQVLKAA